MANVIRHKRGTSNPVAGDFSQTAELLVNTTDGGLFTKTDGGSVVEIGGSDANKADVSHKYHQFGSGQYFFDNYEQGRYFRLFTENATFSVTRFRSFSNVEYYNFSTSSWTSWSGGVSGVQALLDGRQNTGMNVAHANRKFRFTVNVSSGWPTLALYFLQSSWSAISYPGITVTLENATSANGTFTTKDTAVFTSSNTGSTWGIHARSTSSLHNGATYVRVTIDITDWTDSGSYTTVPLKNFEILSNYSGSDLLPFSWDYSQNITVSGTVDGRDLAADGSKLDGIESGATADQTAAEILAAIKTVDGSGSGLDADTLDGQQGSYYAPLASPGLTGTPTAPTAAAGTNTTQVATTAFVSTAVANVVDAAPGALDTLNELAAALGDDANFSTTVTNSIATKLPLSGGEMTGSITFSGSQTVDGRDLSADGAKLDGIESGATADQTASEILTAIKTVDGSGSGLDADLLDGQQGSYYQPASSALTTSTSFSGDVSGTYNNIVVADDSHNHIIGNVDGLQTALDGKANLSGATFTGDVTIGDGTADTQLLIKKADNNVSDHIQFYNGTTRMGEIGCHDTTWLRINGVTAKNIYTPRYIRADSGFFVDGTSKGINGSGNFIGGTIAGASDYGTLLRSNADDTFSGNLSNTSTGYFQASVGTTAQRPGSPAQGMIRFNTTEGCFEGYTGSSWVNMSPVTVDDVGTV